MVLGGEGAVRDDGDYILLWGDNVTGGGGLDGNIWGQPVSSEPSLHSARLLQR